MILIVVYAFTHFSGIPQRRMIKDVYSADERERAICHLATHLLMVFSHMLVSLFYFIVHSYICSTFLQVFCRSARPITRLLHSCIYLSICMSVCLSARLCVCLCICLTVSLCVCLSVCQSAAPRCASIINSLHLSLCQQFRSVCCVELHRFLGH